MRQNKSQLRQAMKARRAAMLPEKVADASESIHARLIHLEPLCDALSIFVYVSVRHEVDTRKLIGRLLHAGKHVCVPRIDPTGRMHAHLIHDLADLNTAGGGLTTSGGGQFQIPTPPEDAPIDHDPDLALVPGLAFTPAGQRLGQGGGHYDRYLNDHPDTLAVGLCYDWQVLDALPTEPHDHPMDWLLTESRMIQCR